MEVGRDILRSSGRVLIAQMDWIGYSYGLVSAIGYRYRNNSYNYIEDVNIYQDG